MLDPEEVPEVELEEEGSVEVEDEDELELEVEDEDELEVEDELVIVAVELVAVDGSELAPSGRQASIGGVLTQPSKSASQRLQ